MRKLASQRWKRNSGSWSELRCRGSDFPAMIWLNIRQTDTPQRSARSTPKPMIRRVNTSITTMTQWLRRSIDSQRNRSTLHRLSFTCPIKLSQDGPSVPASGRECFASTRRTMSLLISMPKACASCCAMRGQPTRGLAAFDLYDRVDELLRRSLRAGTPMTSRREEPPIFAFLERLVESEQGSGLQDDGELRNSAWRHEQ